MNILLKHQTFLILSHKSFDDYMSKLNHIARSKMKNIEAGISGTVLSVHAKSIYKKAWTWCCILATFSTFVWQLSNYYYGEDHTIVTYRKFNEIETDVYPSISLCWTMAISEKNLNAYGNILNREHYAFISQYLVEWVKNYQFFIKISLLRSIPSLVKESALDISFEPKALP